MGTQVVRPEEPEVSSNQRPHRLRAWFARFFERLHDVAVAMTPVTYMYESPRHIFGLPLLSINLGSDTPQGEMRQAKGIIAIGTRATGFVAIGTFLARGVFAIALVGLGGVTISVAGIGLLTVSAFGLGAAAVSVVAIGYLAVGVLAIGYLSVGIVAVGVKVVGIVGIGATSNLLFPFKH